MPKRVRTKSFCVEARKIYREERSYTKTAHKLKAKHGRVDWRTVKLAIFRGME